MASSMRTNAKSLAENVAMLAIPLLLGLVCGEARAWTPRFPGFKPKEAAPASRSAPEQERGVSSKESSASLRLATRIADDKRSLAVPVSRSVQSAKLTGVLDEVRAMVAAGKRPVVVFDIDDTLIHNATPYVVPVEMAREVSGGIAFAKALQAAGAHIVYLTARHAHFHDQTIDTLSHLSYPVGDGTDLMMPGRDKRSATDSVFALGTPVALFDNEATHVRMFRDAYPEAAVFRLLTFAFERDPGGARSDITVIRDFRR